MRLLSGLDRLGAADDTSGTVPPPLRSPRGRIRCSIASRQPPFPPLYRPSSQEKRHHSWESASMGPTPPPSIRAARRYLRAALAHQEEDVTLMVKPHHPRPKRHTEDSANDYFPAVLCVCTSAMMAVLMCSGSLGQTLTISANSGSTGGFSPSTVLESVRFSEGFCGIGVFDSASWGCSRPTRPTGSTCRVCPLYAPVDPRCCFC